MKQIFTSPQYAKVALIAIIISFVSTVFGTYIMTDMAMWFYFVSINAELGALFAAIVSIAPKT